jgi:hypothetical protein
MKKTETTATTTTAATATQAPSPAAVEAIKCRWSHLTDIETICDSIDEALSVLYNHFFNEFYEEAKNMEELSGLPGLCSYMETFGGLVHIAVNKIYDENERLKKLFEIMFDDYKAERERLEAAESAAKERETVENA